MNIPHLHRQIPVLAWAQVEWPATESKIKNTPLFAPAAALAIISAPAASCARASLSPTSAMHYPHKTSKIKRIRKIGFRRRMKTNKGRKIVNRQRRLGRTVGAR